MLFDPAAPPDRGPPLAAFFGLVSEIIVAKNRNGPTGTINLRFRPELTRFENLEARRRGPDEPPAPEPS